MGLSLAGRRDAGSAERQGGDKRRGNLRLHRGFPSSFCVVAVLAGMTIGRWGREFGSKNFRDEFDPDSGTPGRTTATAAG
jgi:hypothetical protein